MPCSKEKLNDVQATERGNGRSARMSTIRQANLVSKIIGALERMSDNRRHEVCLRVVTWCDWLMRLILGFRSIAGAPKLAQHQVSAGRREPRSLRSATVSAGR